MIFPSILLFLGTLSALVTSSIADVTITVTESSQTISTSTSSSSTWGPVLLPVVGLTAVITATDQPVTFSHVSSVLTVYTSAPKPTLSKSLNSTSASANQTAILEARQDTSVVVDVQVIVVDYIAPYNQLGPLAIPGYPGSPLYVAPSDNGTEIQVVTVRAYVNEVISEHIETWISYPATTSTAVATQAFTTSTSVSSNGVYAVTVAPAVVSTVTVGAVPTTVDYAAATLVAPTNGVYEVTISVGYVISVEVSDAPVIYVFGAGSQVYTQAGEYTITIVEAVTVSVDIGNAPTLYYIDTTIAQGFSIDVSFSYSTYISGSLVTVPINQPSYIATATVTATETVVSVTTASPAASATSATATSPAVGAQVEVAGYTYEYSGCFDGSTFTDYTLVTTSDVLTIELCLSSTTGYAYAGVVGTQCYGSAAVSSGGSGSGVCDTPCPGDASEICGGSGTTSRAKLLRRQAAGVRLSVYENLGPVSSSSTTASPTSSVTPNPSSDPDPVVAVKPRKAKVLERTFKDSDKVRRGGVLRASGAEQEKQPAAKKRDFGIKAKKLLKA